MPGGDQEKWLGNQAFKNQEFYKAAEHYSTAIQEFGPKHKELAAVLSNRAMCYLKLENYNLALTDAEACISTKPDWFKGHHRRAEALMGLEKFEEAELAFADIVGMDPGDAIVELVLKRMEEASLAKQGIVFRQLLAGRDHATAPIAMTDASVFPLAAKAQSYTYIVGDVHSKECVLVDPSWDVHTLKSFVRSLGLTLKAVVVTAACPDHVGGVPPGSEGQGIFVPGVTELVDENEFLPVYAGAGDASYLMEKNFIEETNIVKTNDNPELVLGNVRLRFLPTPGPTPGSQVVLINGSYLLSGDLLYPGCVGRCEDDSPAALRAMHHSLYKTLAPLDDTVVCYPGHKRGSENFTLGQERTNGCLRDVSLDDFMTKMQAR